METTQIKSLIVTIFLIVGSVASSTAQFVSQNVIKHYGIEDGLSQAIVNSVAQDSHSLIWVATDDGLNRFDGYSFKVFKQEKTKSKSLAGSFVQSIFKDREGTLWVSSREGLQSFDPMSETFNIYSNDTHTTGPSLNDVSYIADGAGGNLWITWYANGFASFDKETKTFTSYNLANLPALSSGQTLCILDDLHGMLWVGTQDGGLNVFNLKNGKVTGKVELLSKSVEIPDINIRCIISDRSGNVWIGTSKGLVVYLRKSNQLINFNHDNLIKGKNIVSLLCDSTDNLWIGTQGSGIFKLDLRQLDRQAPSEFAFTRIENLDKFDISSQTIQSFFEDNAGNVWIGTYGQGVYMVGKEKEKFIRYEKHISKGSAFTTVSFGGICHDDSGSLWMGTYGNGIFKISADGKEEEHYLTDGRPGSINDNNILSAFCDSKGRIWFGTYAHGIFRYDKATNTFTHVEYTDAKKAGANDVRVIFEDSRGNIWVGTNRGGLCLIDHASNKYSTPGTFSGILRNGDVRSIVEDSVGNLWLGFYGDGLYRFNFETKSFTAFLQDERDKNHYITSRIINALQFDDQQRLWIGTAGDGLFCFDQKNNELKGFSEENGIGSNTIFSIVLDKNRCWASTNSGVTRVELPGNEITNYGRIDGLQLGQFNPASAVLNRRAGYIGFGGTAGLNVFFPDKMADDFATQKVIITNLQLFNRSVSMSDTLDDKPLLSQSINTAKELRLPYDQNVITLEFAGINYTYPEKNIYAYKLDGLDEDWNFVKGQRSATYRYLKPGTYVFRVKASNQEQFWGDEETTLRIVIDPPASRTPLAYTLYFAVALVSGFFVYRTGRKQLSLMKKLKSEKAQRKQERKLAMEKLTFFTEVSHEFRTPLTLIIGPIEEILSKEEQHSPNARKLRMVHRNANKLLNLINKLIDYRKIESGNVFLKVRESNIVTFTKEVFESFRDFAKQKDIQYNFQSDTDTIDVWFDREKLETVLTNIISNSFKYIGNGKEISITITKQVTEKYPEGRVIIKIKDDGVGIPKKHMAAIFEWFYRGEAIGSMNSGIGLSLARKLVNLHKGDISVDSKEGEGSVFTVKIPLGKQHFSPAEVTFVGDEPVDANIMIDSMQPEEEGQAKRGTPSVLIVEDDEEIRSFLREYFESDYKIFEASNGDEGLNLANSSHPDLIISDVMMPGLSGIELCRALKNNIRTSHIPVILLTAKASLTDHKEGIEIGAEAYITKPFSPEILSSTVKNLLQSRAQLMRFYRNLFLEDKEPGESENKVNTQDQKFLQTIYDQLKANLDKSDFNVAELSDTLNMSRSLVYKKIKMLTGLSPTEYIRSLRMQEAAKLLRTQQYKVFEVVYMVGFSDLKYFRESFAKEFGITPSEYMKRAPGSGSIEVE
jgi:signal transduction histidine kinase/ligand-binding sensor domain-containing protein/DNA-binding response OmpR family regulator